MNITTIKGCKCKAKTLSKDIEGIIVSEPAFSPSDEYWYLVVLTEDGRLHSMDIDYVTIERDKE